MTAATVPPLPALDSIPVGEVTEAEFAEMRAAIYRFAVRCARQGHNGAQISAAMTMAVNRAYRDVGRARSAS